MFLLIVTVLQRPQSVPSWQRFWWARFLLCELWWLINCVYVDWKIAPLNDSPAEQSHRLLWFRSRWRNRWIGFFVRGRLGCSASYNTAKNLRHFHLLFGCWDLAVLTTERYESVEYHFRWVFVSVFLPPWFRRRSLFIPAFWAIVFMRPLSLFMPTGPTLNHSFVWSDSAFKLLLTATE